MLHLEAQVAPRLRGITRGTDPDHEWRERVMSVTYKVPELLTLIAGKITFGARNLARLLLTRLHVINRGILVNFRVVISCL